MTLEAVPDLRTLREQLDEVQNYNELLEESLADLELAAEDRGWQRISATTGSDFSREGLAKVASNCRLMALASPLVKRGLQLRIAYVWGQGVQIAARTPEVNDVVQAFLDDKSNRAALTGSQAAEELERALGTDGNVFLALFTAPLTGRVQVRSTPFVEVVDVVANPEDRDEPFFYLRQYQATVVEAGTVAGSTRSRRETRRVYHPALGFYPVSRPKSIDGVPIRWDAPILHVNVNRLDGAKWGVPDAYAGVVWARAYEETLTDWARLVKALSRFAWRLSGDKSDKVRRAAASVRSKLPTVPGATPGPDPVGGVHASGPGVTLEAIPKSGATIDSQAARPLGALVAASLGVPVTMLLADPGVTGARATAETLDKPTILEMGGRRKLWASVYDQVLGYVIAQSVKAPRGVLRGAVIRDEWQAEQVTLAGDLDPGVEVDWPKLDELDPKSLVEAIKAADDTGKVPGVVILRLLLAALGVKDADEVLDAATDGDGNLIDPDLTAAQAAVEAFRRGQDPAEVL